VPGAAGQFGGRKSGGAGKGAGPRWLLQKGISKKRTDAFVLASLAKEK